MSPALFTVVTNVTREMQAYAQLQSTTNEYRALLDATTAGVLKLEAGRIVRANAALETMFGVRSIDLLGRTPVRAFESTQAYRETVTQAKSALNSGGGFAIERRLRRIDGTEIELDVELPDAELTRLARSPG